MSAGAFADWQPRYAEHGVAIFPVQGKRPAIRNYLRLRPEGSRRLVDRFAETSAFGLALKRSGIVVVDVDTPQEKVLSDALARYGDTPFIVRSGSGNFQAWYRRQNEGRYIRPNPDRPIDILGDGFVVAPPSIGEKGPYEIIEGSLADIPCLPTLKNAPASSAGVGGVSTDTGASQTAIAQGQRNRTLWRLCMIEARACDEFDTLLEVARTANEDCLPPLSDAEVVKLARSAWGYTERGENLVGRQHITVAFETIDQLLSVDPDAFVLMTLLLRHHSDRSRFLVANAMAKRMPPTGWTLRKFQSARARLLENGFIACVRKASSIYGPAMYAWGSNRR